MKVRFEVASFAYFMERQLALHDADLGDGWRADSVGEHLGSARAHLEKFATRARAAADLGEPPSEMEAERLALAAADAANYLMFAIEVLIAGPRARGERPA